MRAAVYPAFREPLTIENVPDPVPPPGGVVLDVRATGLCRSDWHGWMGHDADIELPHVPGHEMAGVVVAADSAVTDFRPGDRVTVPFVCACGTCRQCDRGDGQVCDRQQQPGFTHWGSFAEYVALHYADQNLVRLPEDMDFVAAASLGCRFATAWRAVVLQGRVSVDDWVTVFGAGGLGLAAVAIAAARGARPIAVDVSAGARDAAARHGAVATVAAGTDAVAEIRELTGGGANLSLDAFGSAATFRQSIDCLAKRGRHVQVGLMTDGDEECSIPAARLIAEELEILGSHGLSASGYDEMLSLIVASNIDLESMLAPTVTLDEAAGLLAREELALPPGVTVIDRFT